MCSSRFRFAALRVMLAAISCFLCLRARAQAVPPYRDAKLSVEPVTSGVMMEGIRQT